MGEFKNYYNVLEFYMASDGVQELERVISKRIGKGNLRRILLQLKRDSVKDTVLSWPFHNEEDFFGKVLPKITPSNANTLHDIADRLYMTVTESGQRIHTPNPETKHLIQRAFKKYLEPSQSIQSIAKEMAIMGVRTRQGRPYNKSKVEKMLSNPFYIGINRFNGQDYPGAQQPLISKKLFEAVQQKKHGKRPRELTKHNPLFKGLIRCQHCDKLVAWQLQKGRYYGVCKRTTEACKAGKMLREDHLEEMVTNLLDQLVSPSQEIIQWVSKALQNEQKSVVEDNEKLIGSIHTQLERINRMDDRLCDDKLAGDIPQAKYTEKHAQFAAERKTLNERLEKLDQSASLRMEHTLALLELSQRAAALYRTKPVEQKRIIISKLFKELTLKEGEINVQYTKFTEVIAKKVLLTQKIMKERK